VTDEDPLHISISRNKKGFKTSQEIIESLRNNPLNTDKQIIKQLAEAIMKINELWDAAVQDRKGTMAAYRKDAEEAYERVDSYDKALITIGDSINTLLSELPSVTVRKEIRNDIKNQIDDEIFDQLGIKSSKKKPSNPNFLFSSPTLGSMLLNDEQFEVKQSNHSGIKLWTFSAASIGAVSNSQDAISYSFNSWGKNADIPLGIISIADGVSQSNLSGHWARLLAYYSANVQPYPKDTGRKVWVRTLNQLMMAKYQESGPFPNYLNRRNFSILNRQKNEPTSKILNSASTLMQLSFEGENRINWTSVGDSYLFHYDGDNVNSLIDVERTNQPDSISFDGTSPKPKRDTHQISWGDKIIMATDQMGEFLADDINSITSIVNELTNCPNIKSMKKKWIDICNEIWGKNKNSHDDLTMVIISFEPEKTIDNLYIQRYLNRAHEVQNDGIMKFLDEIDENEEFKISVDGESMYVSLTPFPNQGPYIEGANARYYRLSDGLGLKIYSRHDLDRIRNPFINQFLLKETYTNRQQNSITSKWIGGLDLPAFEFVEEIEGLPVIAIVMEHIEGSRLQKYFILDDDQHEEERNWYNKINFNLYHSINKLHDWGIAHGDICASNIIVRDDGTVCLVDLDSLYSNNLLEGTEKGKPGFNPFYQWDENVDVVPYLVISLSLKLLGHDFELYCRATEGEDSLLFSTDEIKILQQFAPEKINAILGEENPAIHSPIVVARIIENISKYCGYMIADALGDEDIADELKSILKSLRSNYLTRDWSKLDTPKEFQENSEEE
jgi:tRNA A-37 threonylcarbamoyl transferase component Bud32/serine/threonine protein phosphatase PrpC